MYEIIVVSDSKGVGAVSTRTSYERSLRSAKQAARYALGLSCRRLPQVTLGSDRSLNYRIEGYTYAVNVSIKKF